MSSDKGIMEVGDLDVSYTNPESEADYIIWVEGATYYAKNGHTGEVTDYASFDAAFNGVASDGIKVIIKTGTFLYSATCDLEDNMVVYGSGNATIIKPDAAITAPAFTVSGDDYVTIANLQIDGNSTATDGIFHTNSANTYLYRLNIHDTTANGILFDGMGDDYPRYGSTVDFCIIYNIDKVGDGKGINIGVTNSQTYSTFRYNTIYDCETGIRVQNAGAASNNNVFIGNVISYCRLYGAFQYASRGGWYANRFNHNDGDGFVGSNAVTLIFDGNYLVSNGGYGAQIVGSSYIMVVNNDFHNNAGGTRDAELEVASSAEARIIGNSFGGGTNTYDVLLYGTTTNAIIIGNSQLIKLGNPDKAKTIFGNPLFVTESSGTATIVQGTTSIAVTHGCSYTPAATDISITPTATCTNDPGMIWVDTIGATTFNVNCLRDPGASGLAFSWAVRKV
jgi:hypothetical protein